MTITDEWGEREHLCGFYTSVQERIEISEGFLGRHVRPGDACLVIADDTVWGSLRERVLGAYTEACAVDPSSLPITLSDSGALVSCLREHVESVLGRGASAVRVVVSLNPSVYGRKEEADWLKVEASLSTIADELAVSICCLYNLTSMRSELALELLRLHSQVMVDGEVCPNPAYVSPEESILSRDARARLEIERCIRVARLSAEITVSKIAEPLRSLLSQVYLLKLQERRTGAVPSLHLRAIEDAALSILDYVDSTGIRVPGSDSFRSVLADMVDRTGTANSVERERAA